MRQKTPEINYKKGPRAMLDGNSLTSKLGDHSLERKTYDGTNINNPNINNNNNNI